MKSILVNEIDDFQPDLIHIHGVFTPLQYFAQSAASDFKIPVLLSPHGMLEPWTWNQHGVIYKAIKRTYWKSILRPRLRQASFIHVITPLESKTLDEEFPEATQILIPNAIDLGKIPEFSSRDTYNKEILFIGRIHPKKGVHLLLEAFKQANLEDWKLIIAGPVFSKAYKQQLDLIIHRYQMEDLVEFLGPVYGQEKYRLMNKSWVVVVPSSSEVVGLVNLESAAVKTPTITTPATGLFDWEESGGLLVENEIMPLSQALTSVSNWSIPERIQRGAQSRDFIKMRYSWQVVGPRWIEAYRQIAVS
jgi:glycosyltransferase involved in cell wall biosynthesis